MFVLVERYVRVCCTNQACKRPADAKVPIFFAAPGVVAMPRLVCESCRCDLQEVPADA